MNSDFENLKEIIDFRKELHQHPELSGDEKNTALRIQHFIHAFHPDKIIKNVGGYSLMVIFEGKEPGKTILFRADMDALPIQEESDVLYKSTSKNVAHLCGHDGHSAILVQTMKLVAHDRPQKGRIIFLFQAAEETGQGAKSILADPKFIFPDYIFGIHNIPGFEKNLLLLKPGIFASASKGMIIKLHGKTSHASEPEKGVSPSFTMTDIMRFFDQINKDTSGFSGLVMATVIHARLGEIAFGITPGYAEVMVTLRSFSNVDMEKLISLSIEKLNELTIKERIDYEISFVEEFPSTENNHECIEMLIDIAKKNTFQYQIFENPFKWSEDFGQFTQKIQGAFIGIGSGKDYPNLHSPSFDFPDEIIPQASNYLFSIYKTLLY